ncbi:serine/threonine protein kinase [[Leptolyngbya] sp. PCC 7376]|uniref:protein kinase domain-containing protein n=1 Tax=[Leptolyngbya] sp. PCC 7376 TaxID=111781 RepID=UPI00029F4869|nr:IMS domain-containing protein [[Leptolyngbya] sp. PCC 7376]AFY37096.1 serine/threonine protein kinase [[Leptolyngbya] sp. PCC 7376]
MTAQLLENRYRILQELGQGGFGETFLAEDLHMPSSRRCVIKQLKPVTNDPAVYQIVKQRFQREATILERLGERNRQIPSLFAYFTESGQFYLVQEWIEGQTLSQQVEKEGLWASTAVTQLLIGLLPILDFIHDQGIVHRDIKPDNIILRQDDRQPVLIDFGAVKETMGTQMNTAGNTTSSIVIGTPGFMPSEQAIGRPVFSSDLYSLGLTAIYLLTGKFPQDFPSDPATGKILWRSPNVQVDKHLANVLEQAICPHPRDRFHSASSMLSALQASNQMTMPMAGVAAAPIPETVVPPSAPPVVSQPTVASNSPAPIPVSTPPTAAATQNFVPATPQTYAPPPKQGMADWQKAILTGGVVGIFFLGGIIGYDQLMGDRRNTPIDSNDPALTESNTDDTNTTETNTETSDTNDSDTNDGDFVAGDDLPPEVEPGEIEEAPAPPEIEKPVDPPPTTTPVTPINEFDAEAIIVDWLICKSELFSVPYDRYCGKQLLTGDAYANNISRNDDKLSSVEWLENNGAFYIFEDQQIEDISDFQLDGRNATIEVIVTEARTLYDAKGNVDQNASGYDQRLVQYNLEFTQDGVWKIATYDTVEILWE